MRAVLLSALKAGMTRLRDKGGASPDSLYQLTNGYVDASGAPTSRQGTTLTHTITTGTKGLCAFAGKLHVFALTTIDPGTTDVVVDVVKHPDQAFAGTIAAVHFAKPFLGYLYVVIEFSDGLVAHYWLQAPKAWAADTMYDVGGIVVPTDYQGYFYKASADSMPAAWLPSTAYKIGDVVQPTTYNGYKYTVTAVAGDSPVSGSIEPAWPASDGGTVTEFIDNSDQEATFTEPPGGSPAGDRYNNMAGFSRRLTGYDTLLEFSHAQWWGT